MSNVGAQPTEPAQRARVGCSERLGGDNESEEDGLETRLAPFVVPQTAMSSSQRRIAMTLDESDGIRVKHPLGA